MEFIVTNYNKSNKNVYTIIIVLLTMPIFDNVKVPPDKSFNPS